ncbi:hypothetical protein CONPUDRAFT_150706 [Coniophora puteana RWD-64-598 SS2]|uniref:Uncharacterized protein n=1 Tax=Coniophora puteana (strain RWD-64-598) TaxID=741705 RepID=A0A5M3MWW4_CONPW|nr:uncharacterized protein CONPUDRAFT_150706 [Coniophora puteana RWD-64-598 SS2]EIW83633.1 hypothetical protein CONPUDRAFT_150706 [Coniophora puteana RWD-64-598 SS2]
MSRPSHPRRSTLNSDLESVGIATIYVDKANPPEDASASPPRPAFRLRWIANPRGRALAIGDKVAAYFARDPSDPESEITLAFRGEVSASHTIAAAHEPTHLLIGPRPLFLFSERYAESHPLFEAPVTLYVPSEPSPPLPRAASPPLWSLLSRLGRLLCGSE